MDKPYRTTEQSLINLWDEVRNIKEDNVVLETMVRNEFSVSLDNDIFNKYDEDEIILCLNYNGLYGLNNINKLMQLNNPNPSVDIGILQYKKDDPILFNDSNRFLELYNNLKGIIKECDKYKNGIFIGTNIYNNQLFIEMLDQTGGRGRYSIAYNEFAYSAYADEHKSDKVYVFPEWGFNANFIYLTSNTCKTVRDADIDVTELQKKLNSGLTVVIAASDENIVQELKKQLNYETEQKVQWTSVEGTQDFISVEISSAGANKHE